MSMNLNGIENKNEYYTNLYFSSVFEENVQDTLKRWREEASGTGERTPWQRLNAVANNYFVRRNRSERFRSNDQFRPVVESFMADLLPALGYTYTPEETADLYISDDLIIPVAHVETKTNGAPLLWIVPVNDADQDLGILASKPFIEECDLDNEEIVSEIFFSQDEPPRWVLFVGLYEIALIDRNKWDKKRYLWFDLNTIFSNKEETTFQAMAALLHCQSLCPKEGGILLDQFDEVSHKHATEVSADLKYALRECIELLGNEVIRDMKERQHVGVFGKDLADDLTLQCLRYMYRILFMLFIESKPELGYAPMKAAAYEQGYSFDSLRDIVENARGDTELELDGTYLKDSLDMLFHLIYNGYPEKRPEKGEESVSGVFHIEPLKAHIFDPERTALIERAKLRNSVLMRIIDLMSMTRGRKGKRRGRISYSNLGINQLGSVYEALLSYRGFFAEEDLYEVKRKDTKQSELNDLDVGYFVTAAELSQYDEDERVRTEDRPDAPLRMHPQGEFIYRLAGREREKSASYYTPEVLTKCLVKYALKELLEGKKADEILQLTVCEPAMGSAAFLNEATSQLAEAYLTAKEKELERTVPHDQRVQELQRIKMYIADRNVYGIDLNPIAVELAEVSLWLNSIYQGGYVPWFRTQINNGNSLIGARRQCYHVKQLSAEKGGMVWYNNAPERIEPGQKRKFGTQVYHFLLGDPGMCNYTDKVIKELEPEKIEKIKKWNKDFCKPLTEMEIDQLLELSAAIDKLWDEHIQVRSEIKEKTTDPLTVWGQPEDVNHHPMTIREKDRIYDELYLSAHQQNAGPYARLKAAMDYWCALWFWPIDRADELPSRQKFIFDMYALLGLDIVNANVTSGKRKKQSIGTIAYQTSFLDQTFFDDMVDRFDTLGVVNLDELRAKMSELKIADEIANGKLLSMDTDKAGLIHEIREGGQHFFHWELEFADVFQERGGFDLVVGNPPWIKLEWNEQAVLGDKQPMFVVKKFTAIQTTQHRQVELLNKKTARLYFDEYESITGQQSFLNARGNYPELVGSSTNLYKCFIPKASEYCNSNGIFGFVHPNTVFDEAGGGILRRFLYPRLRLSVRMENEYKLFRDVGNAKTFCMSIFGNRSTASFDWIVNVFLPSTIDECYNKENNRKAIPKLKDANDNWNIEGHPKRIIKVTQSLLRGFATVFDNNCDWQEARLPLLHVSEMASFVQVWADYTKTVDSTGLFYGSTMWPETGAQEDHTIRRDVHFPKDAFDYIVSGPHIGVANPISQASKRICETHRAFDNVDLQYADAQYRQRCNYTPDCSISTYLDRAPKTDWGTYYTDEYRILSRRRLNKSGERTLIGAIYPPKTGHVHTVIGVCGTDKTMLCNLAGEMSSIVFDAYIKITGKDDMYFDTIRKFPIAEEPYASMITLRALLLNCLTTNYADLWHAVYSPQFIKDRWAKNDMRLRSECFLYLDKEWKLQYALRTDYERRQALVELDVLTAMALGMNLDQLKTIYNMQFAVLQQYEADTWYDQNGRIVFTVNKGLPGVGVDRTTFEKLNSINPIERGSAPWNGIMKEAPAGYIFERTIMDDTQPNGPIERTIRYVAPFDRCDREKDYEISWKFFEKETKGGSVN